MRQVVKWRVNLNRLMASKYNSVDVTRRNYSHGENILIQCAQGHYLTRSRKCAQMYFAHCVDGQFEGVEECQLIVYHLLPRLRCLLLYAKMC